MQVVLLQLRNAAIQMKWGFHKRPSSNRNMVIISTRKHDIAYAIVNVMKFARRADLLNSGKETELYSRPIDSQVIGLQRYSSI